MLYIIYVEGKEKKKMEQEEENKKIIVEILTELYQIYSSGTSPIQLDIGWTDEDGFGRDGIILRSCPPAVISTLIKKGYSLALDHGLLFVLDQRSKKELEKEGEA